MVRYVLVPRPELSELGHHLLILDRLLDGDALVEDVPVVEDDRVEAHGHLVPVREQPDEGAQLRDGDEVARAVAGPATVDADLALRQRTVIAGVEAPVVLLEHPPVLTFIAVRRCVDLIMVSPSRPPTHLTGNLTQD